MLTSKRLAAIADFIDENDNAADIGADHGKLVIELANKYKNNKYLAVENKEGPFQNLINAVKSYNYNKNIECSYSDGIEYLPNYINTLIFAGMGGINVINIINKSEINLKNIKKIVFCVHKDAYLLELVLKKYGFFPSKHEFVNEKGKSYIIFETLYDNTLLESFEKDDYNTIEVVQNDSEGLKILLEMAKKDKKFLRSHILGGLQDEN